MSKPKKLDYVIVEKQTLNRKVSKVSKYSTRIFVSKQTMNRGADEGEFLHDRSARALAKVFLVYHHFIEIFLDQNKFAFSDWRFNTVI